MAISNEQQKFTGLETELVPDYIYGMRAWSIQPLPRDSDITAVGLRGAYNHIWSSGVNNAECLRRSINISVEFTDRHAIEGLLRGYVYFAQHPDDDEIPGGSELFAFTPLDLERVGTILRNTIDRKITIWGSQGVVDLGRMESWSVERVSYYTIPYPRPEPSTYATCGIRISVKINYRKCTGVHPDCTCGFYAYTGESVLDTLKTTYGRTSSFDQRVTGFIRGSGFTTVGTYGFRTQRAEILAIYGSSTPLRTLSSLAEYFNVPVFSTRESLASWLDTYYPDYSHMVRPNTELTKSLVVNYYPPFNTKKTFPGTPKWRGQKP